MGTGRLVMVSVLVLAACGGGHSGADVDATVDATVDAAVDADVDAPPTDAAVVVPHRMIVDQLLLPLDGAHATAYGLDLDLQTNDGVDNQVAVLYGSLDALAPTLHLQTDATRDVDRGTALWLFDLEAVDLTSSPQAVLTANLGTAPSPSPCLSPGDTVCRQHLAGTGAFQIDPASTAGQTIGGAGTGAIAAGRFTGGAGSLYLPIFLGTAPVWVPVTLARAQLDATAGGVQGNIGGALRQADVDGVLIPGLSDQVRATFAADCTMPTPPSCGCVSGSTGQTFKNLYDKTPNNCVITDAEVRAVVAGFLAPDIDENHDGTNDAISIGYRVHTVAATF